MYVITLAVLAFTFSHQVHAESGSLTDYDMQEIFEDFAGESSAAQHSGMEESGRSGFDSHMEADPSEFEDRGSFSAGPTPEPEREYPKPVSIDDLDSKHQSPYRISSKASGKSSKAKRPSTKKRKRTVANSRRSRR
ncbi:MAG: hypothetical protein AB7F86_16160 [Bdellovibrionales bacterium]